MLTWGSKCSNIEKLQKKAIRCITCSNFSAHIEPLFKQLKLLKVKDIFTQMKLKFFHKFVHGELPEKLLSLPFKPNRQTHDHNTRQSTNLFINRVNTTFAQNSLLYAIPLLINSTPSLIMDKIHTHSLQGFSKFIKNHLLEKYQTMCSIPNCFICQRART